MDMKKKRFPLNLQLFADGDGGGGTGEGAGASGAGGGAPGDPGTGEGDKGGAGKVTFSAEQQAEVDRILGERLGKAQSKWEKDLQDKLDEAKTEAEKLAKMNAEQKAEHERQKREKALADRESEISRRELRATALEQLSEKKLPLSLAEVLVYTDADSTNKSLEAVEKAFREAVEAGVNDRLKGDPPGGGGGKGSPASTGTNYAKSANESGKAPAAALNPWG
jgi:alanyl-tRNA synthetase